MPKRSDEFYSALPARQVKLSSLFIRSNFFKSVPSDWHVIITDIKDSTQAVINGLNENVNLVATGSIVAVLNLAFRSGITIPFFFGGDGATFIVPQSILHASMQRLLRYKENTLQNFNLNLRVGTIPVAQIYQAGHEINISKFHVSPFFAIPIILGDGLSYAEKLIKAENYLLDSESALIEEVDLSGMQCRWDKIDPPENTSEVVTLLVIANQVAQQPQVFSAVIGQIDKIYGGPEKRQPISVAKLKLNTTFNRLNMEMRARIGKIALVDLIKTWLINLYGFIYFRTESGKNYLNRLVEMSDTLVLDGKINTVISGNEKQRELLIDYLENLEQRGEIFFGYNVSQNSTMSCYVRDLENAHIHFVDGSEGGYTRAARMLKAKLAAATK